MDGIIYEDFYKDYYKEFLAWKKSGGITDVNKLACLFRSDSKPDLLLLGNDGKIKFLHNVNVTIPHLIELPNTVHIFGISQKSFLSPFISVGVTEGIDFL